MRNYSYLRPSSLHEVFQAMEDNKDKQTKLVAGCTDFMPRVSLERDRIPSGPQPDLLIVDLTSLGMDQVEEDADEVRIGACCTFTALAEHAVIQKEFPALVQAIQEIAGLTIRNVATIGGNIVNASPAADSVPALVALGATFCIAGPNGARECKAEDFFKGPGRTALQPDEVLTSIVLPKGSGKGCFLKLGRRKAETLSTVNAAAYVEQEHNVCTLIRVAVGSVAPTVVRCTKVEDALRGQALTEANIAAAAEKVLEMISPIDDIRATAWYRKKVAPVMVKRVIQASI